MISTRDDLGIGIYTSAEAAFYARVRAQTMRRWIFGDSRGEAVIDAQLGDTEKVVTFLDFVQALAIRAIRVQYKIPLPKIRGAVEKAQEEFGVKYPLAMPHKTFVFSDRSGKGHGELLIRIESGKLVQLSGRESGNYVIKPVAELYMDHLKFDDRMMPYEFVAWSGEERSIIMNPRRRFGEPIVDPCGYTARTLWEANVDEGGLDAAAVAYGVAREDVALAVSYYDHLKGSDAA